MENCHSLVCFAFESEDLYARFKVWICSCAAITLKDIPKNYKPLALKFYKRV